MPKRTEMQLFPPENMLFDKRNECSWKLIEGCEAPLDKNPTTVYLSKFIPTNKEGLFGAEIIKRARKFDGGNCADQRHAEEMFICERSIPIEYKKYHLIFPGTIWEDRDGNLYTPELSHTGGWYMRFALLDRMWYYDYRIVRIVK